jgi:hypothetical protein
LCPFISIKLHCLTDQSKLQWKNNHNIENVTKERTSPHNRRCQQWITTVLIIKLMNTNATKDNFRLHITSNCQKFRLFANFNCWWYLLHQCRASSTASFHHTLPWTNKLQPTFALCNIEVEYKSFLDGAKEISWFELYWKSSNFWETIWHNCIATIKITTT